ERQPMLHAWMPASLTDRLVEQVTGRRRAELRYVAGPKSADGFRHQLEFGHRHQIDPPQLLLAALGFGIERTNCLERIAKEIEPYRHIHAWRVKIDNAATHRILARFAHR